MFADSFVELAMKFVLFFLAQQTGQQQNESEQFIFGKSRFQVNRLHCSKRLRARVCVVFQRISSTLVHKIDPKLRKMH